MSDSPTIVISFKDLEPQEELREKIQRGCRALAEEFPETTRFEITLTPEGLGHSAHGHVTGKQTEVAAHHEAMEVGAAANRLMDMLERLLRKVHDKHRFAARRDERREQQRRRG